MITSSQNPKIQWVRKLLSNRKEREISGCFVVEGIRLTEEAAEHDPACRLLLYSQPVSPRASKIIEKISQTKAEIEEIPADLMASISDTQTPQGILAVIEPLKIDPPLQADFIVIADGIQDPGNAGTLIRTSAAAGADMIIFAPGSADPWSPKVLRSAMGGNFRIPVLEYNWDQIRTLFQTYPGLSVSAADSDGGINYWENNFCQPTALIIGSEGAGPCAEALNLAQQRVLIPMPGKMESLNASVAAGILIFEVIRQRSQIHPGESPL